MRKRTVFILVGGILAVAVTFGTMRVGFAPAPGVTMKNFERLRKGMAMREVEALLGGPPTEPDRQGWTTWKAGQFSIDLYFKDERVFTGSTWFRNDHGGFTQQGRVNDEMKILDYIGQWIGF